MKRMRPPNVGGGSGHPEWPEFDLSGVRMVPQRDPQGEARRLPPRPHMFGLTPAPTFYPSREEFQDPLAYIQKIRPLAESAGLCKIVPPAGWSPPFSLDTKRFSFKTRIQNLNSLEGKTRTNLNYLDQLNRFHSQQGRPLVKVPQLDHRPIDLYGLRHEVTVRGGYQKVNGEKRWAEIGRVMKYDRKTCTSMSNSLKATYQKIILPFDLYLAKHGGAHPANKGAQAGEPSGEAGENDAHRAKRRHSSRNDSATSSDAPSGFSPARAVPPGGGLPKASSPAMSAGSTTTTIPEACEVCRSGENDDSMLICDGCDRGFHMFCLSPPLNAIPTNDWYCDSCVLSRSTDYGFEDGAEYTLDAFKRRADDFKRRFFAEYYRGDKGPTGARGDRAAAEYLRGPQMEGRVPEEVVEEEFWNLVASPYRNVQVEYGADLHSALLGSGFPTTERDPLEPYARHPWNLNMLPFQSESLFNYIHQDISGMMTPWIYVGMCFSTFCWHNEDHYTYSVNYQHWGDTKTWYGVPGRHADKFEDAMRQAVPELFEDQPDLLFQLVTMLSPEVLVRLGVDVVTCDQRAGEFIVTLPQSYHAGFNQGFNFNEAVNFATPDWVPYGESSVRRYQQYARNPVFSHDELLMAMYAAKAEYRAQPWFRSAVADMLLGEQDSRARVRKLWPATSAAAASGGLRELPWDEVVAPDIDIPEDTRQQCLVCKAFSYLSAVVCDCSPNYVSCLLHAEEACKCGGNDKVLMIRYTDAELSDVLTECGHPRVLEDASKGSTSAKGAPVEIAPAEDGVDEASDAENNRKAQIWKDEFRRATGSRDDDDDSLGDAQTVASNGATAREGRDAKAAVGPPDELESSAGGGKGRPQHEQPVAPPMPSPAVKGTMTLADLNRRPDLTQIVLLLEEAQRLVLHGGLAPAGDQADTKLAASSPRNPVQSRGHDNGRGRGRWARYYGQSNQSNGASGGTAGGGSGGGVDGEGGAGSLEMVGKEIEQLIATYSDGFANHRRDGDGDVDAPAPMPSVSVADLHILGDVRQLNRFVQRAQEWCRAAQALLMCMGHASAVDLVVSKQQANYAWHRQRLQRRFSELLVPMATPQTNNGSASAASTRRGRGTKRYKADSDEELSVSAESNALDSPSSSSGEEDDEDDGTYKAPHSIGPRPKRTPDPKQRLHLNEARHAASPFAQSLVKETAPTRLVDQVRCMLNDDAPQMTSPGVGRPRKNVICPFTTQDLSELLRRGEQLYFTSPEFEVLLEWELRALRAEQAAQAIAAEGPELIGRLAQMPASGSDANQEEAAAATPETATQAAYGRKLASMTSELRLIGLQFSASAEIVRIEHALEWCHSARTQLLQRTLTHASLGQLLEKAGEYGLDERLEILGCLVETRRDVVAWTTSAKEIITSQQLLDLRDVGKLLEKGRNIAVLPDNYQMLRDLQQKALDLQARTDAIVERTESQEFMQRPRYGEARALVATCGHFKRFEPSGLGQVRDELAKADAWFAEVESIFAPKSAAAAAAATTAMTVAQLDATLEPIQRRLRRALVLTEGDAAAQPTPAACCICLAPEEGLVAECCHCRVRYHARCMNLEQEDLAGRQFLCPLCDAAAQGEKVRTPEVYPTLSRVSRAVDECRNLGLIVPTLDPLVTILLDGQALSSAARRAARDRSAADVAPADEAARRVPLLRVLVRALVGLGLNIRQGVLSDLWEELQRLARDEPAPEVAAGAVVALSPEEAVERRQWRRGEQAAQRRQQAQESEEEDEVPLLDQLTGGKPELAELYQAELEDLLFAIVNPPPVEGEHGQGLMPAGSTFKRNEENCVCNMRGVDLEAAGMAREPAIQCDACREFFHIGCVQVPADAARVVRWHQLRRTMDADIDADVPDAPDGYVCPGCCVKMGTMYAYGEIVIE
ncbi:hypothetical protein LPJ61_001072 [Coemansia biformis]|uniref:[histone H3]-trimethyl-L-lysine(4) demethylase n=1 Tax=Coemansia biformis TaxID=1286918 RepID=A0A9W7YH61_9FUNG|nr:hypothetical protein LPJ61_001072 [Coemansia biformis]